MPLEGVTENMAPLSNDTQLRPAVRRHESAVGDRRGSPRQGVAINAIVTCDETRVPVTIVDLSVDGCGIKINSGLTAGTRLRLIVSGFRWPCTILWSEAGRAGLKFDYPMHPGIVNSTLGGKSQDLTDYLQRLISSSRP
jgi:hypothetical protein